jgi:hypothetical protein
MTLKPSTFLFLLLLILNYPLGASNPAEISFNQKAKITFRYNPHENNTLSNYYIKEIARLNFLNLYETHFSIDLEVDVKIIEDGTGGYTMRLGVYNPVFGGDFYYKGFDLSEVLTPAKYDLTVLLNGSHFNDTVKLSGIQPNREWITLFDSTRVSVIQNLELKVIRIEPRHYYDSKTTFINQIAQINRFLAYAEMLDFNLKKAIAINPETSDSILPVYMQIYDLKRFEDLLSQLEIKSYVPEKQKKELIENRKSLNSHLRRLQTLFFQNLNTLKPDISGKQFEEAAQTLISIQKKYLREMMASNHLFEPGYLEVADFFGNKAGWEHIAQKLAEEIFTDGGSTRDKLNAFTAVLYRYYSATCDSLISNESFNEAAIFASSAKTFCEANPDDNCEIFTFNKIARTRFGIFDAYLRVAESAMENDNLPFSLKYIRLAQNFQKQNSSYIIIPAAVNRLMEQLAWNYLETGERFYDEEDFMPALESYEAARDLYLELDISQYAELIDKRIKKCVQAKVEIFTREE